jgi:broad specificity phosphatase PhoE
MEIILYRHAKPGVSTNEIICGSGFSQWVQRYNDSGIIITKIEIEKEKVVYTSDLLRSIETGKLLGEKIIQDPLFREAEIPLVKFPAIRLKIKFWLFLSRFFWFLGLKTKCESFNEAKLRVKHIVDKIELCVLENQKMVIVGHGCINRLIKIELLRRCWILKQSIGNRNFLSKMIFKSDIS